MIEKTHAYIESNRDALCASLQELVRIPTVNPPGDNYAEIVGLLDERCRELGMQTRIVPVPEAEAVKIVPHADAYPRMNLIARWDLGAEKTVHFNSHFDVVPVSGKWRAHPFDPQIKGDWLYGRGSDDMKDSIAALLFAISALQETGMQPNFNIECSFTCDEEIGGDLGAGEVVRKGLAQADYAVNCEGSTGLTVCNGHHGVLWLEVAVHGKSAHAADPGSGLNAFEKTAELVAALQPLKEEFDKPQRIFKMSPDIERKPTINIGGVFSGTSGDKINTVPAQVTFSIDRRIPPNERLHQAEAELRGAIQAACKTIPDLKVDVKTALGIEPCLVDSEETLVREFSRSVRAIRRNPVKWAPAGGFTDLHFFVEDGKLPGVGYGPRGEGAHGVNERVSISDLVKTTKIYATFMTRAEL